MYACSGESRVFETAAVSWSIFKDAYVSILLCEVMISDGKIQLVFHIDLANALTK